MDFEEYTEDIKKWLGLTDVLAAHDRLEPAELAKIDQMKARIIDAARHAGFISWRDDPDVDAVLRGAFLGARLSVGFSADEVMLATAPMVDLS